MGSADICQDRWDTSAHIARDPRRVSRKDQPHKPYHEVQAVFAGDVARTLVELFAHRWEYATGTRLDVERLVAPEREDLFADLPVTLPMPVAPVGFSRTVPAGEERAHVHEIRDLYIRAICRAERMIYIETQYLTSQCVRDTLIARMKDTTLPKLDIVMVLPQKPEKLKEEVFIGGTQADVLSELAAVANRDRSRVRHLRRRRSGRLHDDGVVRVHPREAHDRRRRVLHDGLGEPRQSQHDGRLGDQPQRGSRSPASTSCTPRFVGFACASCSSTSARARTCAWSPVDEASSRVSIASLGKGRAASAPTTCAASSRAPSRRPCRISRAITWIRWTAQSRCLRPRRRPDSDCVRSARSGREFGP